MALPFLPVYKAKAQCPTNVKVENITLPTCGSANGLFTVLISTHTSNVEVSVNGGTTFLPSGGLGTTANTLAFTGLALNLYHIVIRVAGTHKACQSFDYILRGDYGSAYTVTPTASSNCAANGSILLGGGVLATDSVSWISNLVPVFVTVGSLTAKNIPNLATGMYYVTFKSPGSQYCYSTHETTVANTGTACPAATFCGNATDPANLFPNGTFGSGGNADGTNAQINGPALAAGLTAYTYLPLTTASPQDGFYSIVNNTDAGTDQSIPFGFYPTYDHDYAVTGIKNGYTMVVNASYDPDIVIQQTVNNLCPHKKYQFSAYIKQLQSKVGDIPTNLSFLVNGVGLYTTGDILAGNGNVWQQVGFTFQPTGSSAVISIRNNEAGGNGNDWTIDDIYIGDCVPAITLNTISGNCTNPVESATATITDASKFYTTYQWQVNENDGNGFVNVGAVQSVATTDFDAGNSYTASVSLPDLTTNIDAYAGWQYKIIVGTNTGDLTSPTCSYTATQTIVIPPCDVILPIKIVSIAAVINNNKAVVNWKVDNQLNVAHYELEKSTDGKTFAYVTTVAVSNNNTNYMADDNSLSDGTTYYRIKEADNNGTVFYSEIVSADKTANGETGIYPNPAGKQLFISAPANMLIHSATIVDATGRKILQNVNMNNTNSIDVSSLSPGFYSVTIVMGNGGIINKSFIKK